jgi:predicted dehydrogenase
MLAKEKPDIVIVATPDHWHALCCIAAIESGANVYVEKPVGHTIMEGRAMVNAARKHGRTVQVGTHRRVSPHNISGMEFLKSGKVGKIGMVRAFVHYGGKDWIGISGVDLPLCIPTTQAYIHEDSDNIWITPTVNWAIGAFIGWIK